MRKRNFAFFDLFLMTAVLSVVGIALSLGGCSQEKEVLDVETPGMNLEVKENTETGELSVEGEFGEN